MLAKVYGDIDPKQFTIECCSRTDAGVHATSLVAQFYCSPKASADIDGNGTQVMPMRPNSHDDASNFIPLPFDSKLPKFVFVLNRMLPPDIRVVAASLLPHVPSPTPSRGPVMSLNDGPAVFHPTLHTMSKTYRYQFVIGPVHDPLQTRRV